MPILKWSSGVRSWGQPIGDVKSIDHGDISAEEFRTEFIDRCRPVLIRSATTHWPAAKLWCAPDYLAHTLKDVKFEVHTEPVIEMSWRRRLWPDRFAKVFDAHSRGVASLVVSFDNLMELATSKDVVFAYSVKIDKSSSLSVLHDDIGGFDIVPNPGRPHYYPPLRAFVHGISYTDWHCHPDDNTLMCQFGRSKTLHLLPPDQFTWDVMLDVAQHEDRVGPADPERFPRLKTLKPRVAVVNPGDAIYIPPNWWHAVACTEEAAQLGVTVAWCWGSPLHIRSDPRFPYRSIYAQHGPITNRLKMAAAAIVWRALALSGKTLAEIPG